MDESIYCPKCTCQRCSCKDKQWKRIKKSEVRKFMSEAMFNRLADQGLLGLYLAEEGKWIYQKDNEIHP